ncbi:MAG: hypothetical protein SVZ03_08550 [Spirochaetota bacterium]|nr:hypothetical protein [Spirochaetota bacterium]
MANSINNIIEEVFEEISKANSVEGPNCIPHSDEFINQITANIAITVDLAKMIIGILHNSHKILTFEIVAEDKLRESPPVQGYVEANLDTIKRLKSYFQNELIIQYETEFHKRLSIHQVIKAVFPIIKSLNNTPIGKIANKAIMLGEYEGLLENQYDEFTDEWKEEHLKIELSKANLSDIFEKNYKKTTEEADDIVDEGEKKSQRAVDSKQYVDYISRSKSYPLDRILKIYGVDFYFRINIRKYKFSYLKGVIEKSNVFKRSDLLLLRDMLRKVKINLDKDPNLSEYEDIINNLERSIYHRLYFKN